MNPIRILTIEARSITSSEVVWRPADRRGPAELDLFRRLLRARPQTLNVPGQNRRGQVVQVSTPATDGRPCPSVWSLPTANEMYELSLHFENHRRARTPVGCRQECLHYVAGRRVLIHAAPLHHARLLLLIHGDLVNEIHDLIVIPIGLRLRRSLRGKRGGHKALHGTSGGRSR